MARVSLQDEINKIIFDKKLKESWIAENISITPQRLNYQLHMAKQLDQEIYHSIKDFLVKAGVINSQVDECSKAATEALQHC